MGLLDLWYTWPCQELDRERQSSQELSTRTQPSHTYHLDVIRENQEKKKDFNELATIAYMRARAVFQRSAGKGVVELLFGDLPIIFNVMFK